MIFDKKKGINTHLRGILISLDTGKILRYPSFFDTETGQFRLVVLKPGQIAKILHNAHVPTVADLEEIEGQGRIQFIALPRGLPVDMFLRYNPQLE